MTTAPKPSASPETVNAVVIAGAAPCSAKSVKSWIKRFWLCGVMQSHDWTCAAEQGIPATPKQLADGIAGFWSYATMYCARCGKVSELSKRRQQ